MVYLHKKAIVSDLDVPSQSIAQFNRIRDKNPLLNMTQAPKMFYGYKEPKIYPKVAGVIGSVLNTNVGQSRAVGACRWKGTSAYYVNGGRPQAPIYRNEDIRLQYPRIQRKVADVIQVPPKMYGEYSQRVSPNVVF